MNGECASKPKVRQPCHDADLMIVLCSSEPCLIFKLPHSWVHCCPKRHPDPLRRRCCKTCGLKASWRDAQQRRRSKHRIGTVDCGFSHSDPLARSAWKQIT